MVLRTRLRLPWLPCSRFSPPPACVRLRLRLACNERSFWVDRAITTPNPLRFEHAPRMEALCGCRSHCRLNGTLHGSAETWRRAMQHLTVEKAAFQAQIKGAVPRCRNGMTVTPSAARFLCAGKESARRGTPSHSWSGRSGAHCCRRSCH